MAWDNTAWNNLLKKSNDKFAHNIQPYKSPTVVTNFENYKANDGKYPTVNYVQVEAQTDPRFTNIFDDNGDPLEETTTTVNTATKTPEVRQPLNTGIDLSNPNSGSFLADYYKGMLSLADKASQQKYDLLKSNLNWQKEQHNLDLQFQRDIRNQQQAFARSQWADQMNLYQKNMDFQRERFDWAKEIQQANLDFQKEQFAYNKSITDWELGAKKWALDIQKNEYKRKAALRDKLTASYGGN